MDAPKVLVGCTSSDAYAFSLTEFSRAVKKIDYPNFDVLVVDGSEDDIHMTSISREGIPVIKGKRAQTNEETLQENRAVLARMAITGRYDFLLLIDPDVVITRDALRTLIATGKDVISGITCAKTVVDGKQVIRPLIWDYFSDEEIAYLRRNVEDAYGTPLYDVLQSVPDDDEAQRILKKQWSMKDIGKRQLLRIKAAGFGCLLIATSILKDAAISTTSFFDDLERKGISLFVYTGVQCERLVPRED